MFQSISISFNSFSIVFNNPNFSIFFSIIHKQQYFQFQKLYYFWQKSHTFRAPGLPGLTGCNFSMKICQTISQSFWNLRKCCMFFQNLAIIALKRYYFSTRSKKAKWPNHFFLQNCFKKANGNPGNSSERLGNVYFYHCF
jgi:hypothetical protein